MSKVTSEFFVLHTLHLMDLCHPPEQTQYHLYLTYKWIIHLVGISAQDHYHLECFLPCWRWFSRFIAVIFPIGTDLIVIVTLAWFLHLCVHHCLKNILVAHIKDMAWLGNWIEQLCDVHSVWTLEGPCRLQDIQSFSNEPLLFRYRIVILLGFSGMNESQWVSWEQAGVSVHCCQIWIRRTKNSTLFGNLFPWYTICMDFGCQDLLWVMYYERVMGYGLQMDLGNSKSYGL